MLTQLVGFPAREQDGLLVLDILTIVSFFQMNFVPEFPTTCLLYASQNTIDPHLNCIPELVHTPYPVYMWPGESGRGHSQLCSDNKRRWRVSYHLDWLLSTVNTHQIDQVP